MSGAASEANLQTQWQNAVDILEKTRVFADGLAADSGELEVLENSVDGEFTPRALTEFAANYRADLSDLLSPSRVLEALEPIIREYGNIIATSTTNGEGFGGHYTDIGELHQAIYEHFIDTNLYVDSRSITFSNTGPTTTGTGNGTLRRLTVDENNEPLESCHVEKKRFLCRQDQNSGVDEWAEVFEYAGENGSPDNLSRFVFGSGERVSGFTRARHAGTGAGGSLLRNSSFSTYSATATPKYAGWTQTLTGGAVAGDIGTDQTADNTYRGSPGTAAADDRAVSLTAPGGTSDSIKLSQPLADMRVSQLDPNTPYFLRVMYKPVSSDGTLYLRLGDESTSVAVSGSTWQELVMPIGQNSWFNNFNEDGFDVEIEWTGGLTGSLLLDDVIFAPFEQIDGTFYLITNSNASPTPFEVNDQIDVADDGGNPATSGKINYYLFLAGLRALPSSGTTTFSDP